MSNTDLQKAIAMLCDGSYTCVLVKNGQIRTATARGVKPLVQLLEKEGNMEGFSAADKVVGRATAFLYALLGVKAVFAQVMSEKAVDVLKNAGITVEYATLVPTIINRRGDGICPFEEAVLSITQSDAALAAIYKKMSQLGISASDSIGS